MSGADDAEDCSVPVYLWAVPMYITLYWVLPVVLTPRDMAARDRPTHIRMKQDCSDPRALRNIGQAL